MAHNPKEFEVQVGGQYHPPIYENNKKKTKILDEILPSYPSSI
jgi:hypothetical protein